MKSLYNKYEEVAVGIDADDIKMRVDDAINIILAIYGKEYPLHEIQSVAFTCMSATFSEARLIHGLAVRTAEKREAKKNANKTGD
jgi:hypothetical protein